MFFSVCFFFSMNKWKIYMVIYTHFLPRCHLNLFQSKFVDLFSFSLCHSILKTCCFRFGWNTFLIECISNLNSHYQKFYLNLIFKKKKIFHTDYVFYFYYFFQSFSFWLYFIFHCNVFVFFVGIVLSKYHLIIKWHPYYFW